MWNVLEHKYVGFIAKNEAQAYFYNCYEQWLDVLAYAFEDAQAVADDIKLNDQSKVKLLEDVRTAGDTLAKSTDFAVHVMRRPYLVAQITDEDVRKTFPYLVLDQCKARLKKVESYLS